MDGVDSVGLRDGGGGGERVDEVPPGELEVVVDARVSPLEASGGGDIGDLSGGARLDPSEGLDHGDVDGVVADRVSEVKEEVPGGDYSRSDDLSSWCDRESDRIRDDKDVGEPGIPGDGELDERKDDAPESSGKASSATPAYNSFMSEFDDYVINEKNNLAESSAQNALRYGYNVGDMVWGKVKSHPWWPGHIFNEVFASSSVRKSRRDGSVLVAFFGDSSYGWFDPSELIPFETNFAEKSKQTTSRAFTKAVEEAVDEAGRRRGLGLACKCRNPYSFRPTSVRGYFTVDIPDYEPGSVYSVNQIAKARERFNPLKALSFVKRLALAPKHHDPESLDAVENKSTVFAYRKAIFEEFDETYAQAFGVQAARPSHNSSDVRLAKEPSRAPLSGPLVIAEALVGAGASAKTAKVKDHSKKEKYLLKRRDDTDVHQINRIPGPASSSAAYKDGLTVSATGGYVLQKRSTSHVNAETTQNIEQSQSAGGATLSQQYAGQDAVGQQLPANRTDMTGHLFDYAQSSGDLMGPPPKHGDIAEKTDVSSPRYDPNSMMKVVARAPSVMPAEMKSRKVEGSQGQNPVPDGVGIAYQSIADAKRTKFKADGAVKKTKKILIGPGAENIGVKKKLKRKEMDSQDVSGRPKKQLLSGKAGASMPKMAGKMAQLEAVKKIEGKGSLASSRLLPDAASVKDLQQLLTSLQVLAIDHSAFDKSIRAVTKRSFLGFRGLVYEKSLVLAPPTETDSSLTQPTKAQAEVGAPIPPSKGLIKTGVSRQPSNGVIKKPRSIKTVKPAKARPDAVPVKVGQKRPLSDFQEEIEAKRIKRMKDLKSLAAEKRAVQKVQDTPLREAKDAAPAVPSKATKSLPSKKIERPRARVSAPTMLVMKFPPGFSLPSVPELKARFARFGPLDSSRIVVLWKSLTCRVVFQHKSDAEAALNYAVGNGSLFGSASVRYHIRDAGALASDAPDAAKGRGEDDSVRTNEPLATHAHGHPLVQPSPPLQLKSCLKKPPGDASGPVAGNNGSRGARVKFVLGGEETDRQEKAMVSGMNSNAVVNGSGSASYGDGAASSSSVGTVINSKAFQKRLLVESAPYQMPPLLPNPPRPQPGNGPQSYSGGASTVGMGMQQNASNKVDISQQMISLLTRCNDVVKDLSGLLGYLPYHPL